MTPTREELKIIESEIVRAASNTYQRYGSAIPLPDIIQQSWLFVAQRWHAYDGRATWQAWLRGYLVPYLIRWAAHEAKSSIACHAFDDNGVQMLELPLEASEDGEVVQYDPPSHEARPDKLADWHDRLQLLSADARAITQIILDGPGLYFEVIRNNEVLAPRHIRGSLKHYLRKQGWSWSRLWSAFEEVRELVAC